MLLTSTFTATWNRTLIFLSSIALACVLISTIPFVSGSIFFAIIIAGATHILKPRNTQLDQPFECIMASTTFAAFWITMFVGFIVGINTPLIGLIIVTCAVASTLYDIFVTNKKGH